MNVRNRNVVTASGHHITSRSRMLRLNRTLSWFWLAAMAGVALIAVRQNQVLSSILIGVAIATKLYFFCHAGVAAWAYRFPWPRATRFHFILYTGYLILLLTLTSSLPVKGWSLVDEEMVWALMMGHVAAVSWSALSRYRMAPAVKAILCLLSLGLVGVMAFVSVRTHRP